MTTTNDITGDALSNIKGDAEAYAKGWDTIWGIREYVADEIFTYQYCGMPSKYAPEDQWIPLDYCHESDHGF